MLQKGYVPVQNAADYSTTPHKQFAGTPPRIAYLWFKQAILAYQNIKDVKAVFLKCFNQCGQTVKQHMTTWNNLKLDLVKHDMDVFTHQLQLLVSILYMTEDQTSEKFKDSFDMNIAAHLIECKTLDEAREKAEKLVFIYKSNNLTTASTVLLHNHVNNKKEVQEHQLAFQRLWRGYGSYQRGRGLTPLGMEDPQYKGILQYCYICCICHSRGHYDHQCHTLQHLFHAMQYQSGQNNHP